MDDSERAQNAALKKFPDFRHPVPSKWSASKEKIAPAGKDARRFVRRVCRRIRKG